MAALLRALRIASVLALAVLLLPALARAEDRLTLSSTTLVANGNFVDGLAGWAGHASRLKLVPTGVAGQAVRVFPRRALRHPFIFRSPRPVQVSRAGTVYVSHAWVRSIRAPGHLVCLRMQEVTRRGRVVHGARTCVRTTRKWRQFTRLRYRARHNGVQLGVSVRSVRRATFEVDAVTLRTLTATSAPQPQTWLNPFPANSLWNAPLSDKLALDPASDQKIRYWLDHAVKYPNMPLHAWNTPIAIAGASTPRYSIACKVYACPDLNQFGPVPIPPGTKADPTSDAHLAIWDPTAHREWDLWVGSCCWNAGSGGSFSTDSSSPALAHGANAANFPLLAGLVRPEEIKRGRIDHPLVFAQPDPNGTGHRCPAAHHDGSNTQPLALKEGTLMQLDPAVNVQSLSIPAWQKTIASALQRYGMYLEDGGGSLAIESENPVNRGYDAWARVGLTGNSVPFSAAFPWNRMRVLAPPAPWCSPAG